MVTELQNALASAARVFELIDQVPIRQEAEDAAVLKDVQGKVELDHVDFSYVPEVKLIEDFSLKVKPGQRVALVGPTGCGKTTVINLLMRFYDVNGGGIFVDGRDIRKVTRKSLRESYGMVLQETWLKSGTIRENIAYGRPGASLEEVTAAAKEAHAHSFIKRMPQGYDTVISEDGEFIPGAEAAFMHCPCNALSSADADFRRGDFFYRYTHGDPDSKAFSKMMEGRTSFIVAHRLSTIREADVILVMKDGHIIEQGTHEGLLEQGGFYAELYNSQFAVTT